MPAQVNVEVYTGQFLSGPPGHAIPLTKGITTEMAKKQLRATGRYVCEFPLYHDMKWEAVPENHFWEGDMAGDYPRHVMPSGRCEWLSMSFARLELV